MRAERWRRSGDFARRLREPRRDAGEAYGTVGRVDCLEETDGIEMRVVEQLIGCAQRRGRNAEFAQQIQPFLRRALEEGFGELAVDRIDLRRSEEHTSELQSLMRISYAVFCLKKKTSYND